jgi:hypothetical protein
MPSLPTLAVLIEAAGGELFTDACPACLTAGNRAGPR